MESDPERARVEAATQHDQRWVRWGPYLSERQWGTVREDYSADGNAWDYFPFEMARVRAYRWGEDGILGICDNHQRLCVAPAFWNERDEIVKERLYGLNGHQGNHGEDVKEYWWHLDAVPSHAYLKGLYRYPHAAYPYAQLREENARRGRAGREYELADTGIFAGDAYFDVVAEYAKRAPDDILIRYTVTNRGAAAAPMHLLAQFWFRNEWSWKCGTPRPQLRAAAPPSAAALELEHATLGKRWVFADGGAHEILFTENDTDYERAFGVPSPSPYVKSGIDRAVRGEGRDGINPARTGSKAALHYTWTIPPGATQTVRLRMTDDPAASGIDADFDATFDVRAAEADRFYAPLAAKLDEESATIQRRAFAGLIWTKQFYNYVVRDWLNGDPSMPPPPESRKHGRNANWRHLYNDDVISMPDAWEYPWYASWDLAFHVIPFGLIDPKFAKDQLVRLTREWYMHPNGQLPAYEWAFDDVNPPVQAWAALRVYRIEAKRNGGVGDYRFLERVFQKLLMNFTWWVNRKDLGGRNVFQGGFLGLDNIGAFDRGALPAGTTLAQSDGTSWMGVYALNMLAIAVELAKTEEIYEDVAEKFFEHFLIIADAMNSERDDDRGLWDDEDEFYYDQLYLPTGERIAVKVRSFVGILPTIAVEPIPADALAGMPRLRARIEWFLANRPELAENVARMDIGGMHERRLMAIVSPQRLRTILRRAFDPDEFLSPHGLRMLSRFHKDHPYVLCIDGSEFRCDYEPAESTSGLFGGNSNWRGPVWMPLNYLFIEALQKFHYYLGDEYTVEFPTGSGTMLTLWEISLELQRRLIGLFRRDENGRRPFNGANAMLQSDPHWRDQITFYEYFDGETGEGLGASHQTGWTALVAKMIQQLGDYGGPQPSTVAADFDVKAAIDD